MHVRILDKYIFREVCKAFLFGICAFSAVFIGSGTLFKIAKYITDYGASLSAVIKVFVFGLPNVIMWTFPMSMLLATLLTFGRLSSSSEITAMKSCGIGFFRTAYYIPSILGSSVAIAVLWRALFAIDGLLNSFLAVFGIDAINWLGEPSLALMSVTLLRVWQFGSAMVIFLAALQNVPQSQYEAAMIDGASKWQMFMKVTVPLITPVIFFNFIMQTTQAFQEFTGPYVITGGGPTYYTYLVSLYIYDTAFKYFDMGYGAALAWVLFLVVAVFASIAFKSSKYWVFYSADKGGKNG